jgi:beta-carotene ketolase (CrtW type)
MARTVPYAEGLPERLEAGIVLAVSNLVSWALLMAWLLTRDLEGWSDLVWAVPGFLLAAWLYTGLFITAHDGMHGVISRRYPWVNRAIGSACTLLYAGMDYRALHRAHWKHHGRPGTPDDPDFDPPGDGPPWRWFLTFMRNYATVRQIVLLFAAFGVLWQVLEIPLINLWVFWFGTSMTSTLQLFVVGTWLPHRAGPDLTDPHRARTVDLPPWLSLLACFHFGYHVEHHTWPHVPWWRLPAARRARVRGLAEAA